MSIASRSSASAPSSTATRRPSTSGSNRRSISQPISSTSNTSPLTSSSASAVSLRISTGSGLFRTNSNVSATPSTHGTVTPAAAPSRQHPSILDRIKNALSRPAVHSLLHGAGLKPLSYKKRYKGPNGQEVPKPVLSKSWVLALFSIGTHVLPTMITVFLITFNAKVMVNGPPISVPATYVLQGASKLHVRSKSGLIILYVLTSS